VTYPGALSLSRAHLTHLTGLICGHRARIGTAGRQRPPSYTPTSETYATTLPSARSWPTAAPSNDS
jgi:hypothetical protein